jgi:hypothetical protein
VSARFLPPAEPPDPIVAAALEDLRRGRAEKREAARVLALLSLGPARPDPRGDAPLFAVRRQIELDVAQYRLQRWTDEVRRLEDAARALGLRVL